MRKIFGTLGVLAMGLTIAAPAYANMPTPTPTPTYHTHPSTPCEISRWYEGEALMTQAIFTGHITTDKNVLAFYPNGEHAIAQESAPHYGIDLVLAGCEPGQVYQWFSGIGEYGKKDADDTDFKVAHYNMCPTGWLSLPNAASVWGSYLFPGATYCAKTLESAMPF